jgi:hypothetical protein
LLKSDLKVYISYDLAQACALAFGWCEPGCNPPLHGEAGVGCLGRQWLLLPGLALEAIPALGVLPFWLLVVAAIAVLGTPRPKFES